MPQVTKSHGSVAKCFAVILGIVLTGILRGLLTEDTLSVQMVLSAICVILGITLHQARLGLRSQISSKLLELIDQKRGGHSICVMRCLAPSHQNTATFDLAAV